VVERLVDFEVECEVTTTTRLALWEELTNDFELGVVLELIPLLLWLREDVRDKTDAVLLLV
jgi:hypothetical protein